MAAGTFETRKTTRTRKLSRKTALSLGMTLAASMAVSATVQAAAPIVVTQVEHGSAGFATSGNTTTITAANQTIIDYSKFDIPTGDTVRFIQPGSTATVLNRISGASPTAIDGNLFANGIVYMVNPAGVMFGQGAVINVGQIFAAAGNLSNSDFLQGINHFTDVTGSVLNAGNIHASAVNFVGQMVANSGEIIAPKGTVVMAAGNDVLIGKMDGNMFVKVSGDASAAQPNAHAAVSNTGTVDAKDGQVNMSAGDMFSLAIRNTGSVTAGNITIHGGSHSTVLVSGKLDAANQGGNGKGGTIKINGGNIGVGVARRADGNYADSNTLLNASGTNGGGKILIGVKADSSSTTGYSDASNYDYIGADALLEAMATGHGAGGLVDTSGATLTVSPTATILTAGAGGGAAGQWLLDPVNVQITGATSSNIGTTNPVAGTTEFSPTAATPSPATVSAAAITAALTAGDNVTVSTTPATGPDIGTDQGDITLLPGVSINPVIPGASIVLLKLSAANNIDIEGTIASTGAGIMDVHLDAAGNIYIGGAGTTPGAGSITTFSSLSDGGSVSLNTNGGSIYLDSTSKWAINSAGAAGGGYVSLNAGGTLDIPGVSGTPAAPGPGGIATGGGSLLLEARGRSTGTAISLGTVTLSSAGYAPGTGGGGIGIVCIGLGNIIVSGTTLDANGAKGAGAGAYGSGGAIGIVTENPDGGYGGEITLANLTMSSEGNGGGAIRVWPGGADAGYLYQPVNLQNPAPNSWTATRGGGQSYPFGDGFLIFQGANIIKTAQLGPVLAGSGTGGAVNISVTAPTTTTPIAVTWNITGGTGGVAASVNGTNTAASGGGGLTVQLRPTITFLSNPSGSTGTAVGGGAASGVAGLSTFNAFNTYFETYGTGINTIQPSVTSDGGGQDYENAEQPPGATAPTGDNSVPYIVGDIIVGGTQGVTAAATATLSDTGVDSTGAIILNGEVDGIAPNLDNLITITTAGSISYNYGLGQNVALQNWIAIAGSQLPTQDFIASGLTLPSATGNFSMTPGTAIGQLQLGTGPAVVVNDPVFDISYPAFQVSKVGGIFVGTTTGNMYLQGAIVSANVVTYGSNPAIHTGAVLLNSTTGNIDMEAYAYGPWYSAGANWEDPLAMTSAAPATINGNPNNAINIDGSSITFASGSSGTGYTMDGVNYSLSSATTYAFSGQTFGAIVPVQAIYASAGGFNVPDSGFSVSATQGGNIFIDGPSPATVSSLFQPPDGFLSNGGYTVATFGSPISVLAMNSNGAAGNIHFGQSVFLSTDGGSLGVASVGTTGNAGNLTFDEGAKFHGGFVTVASLSLDPTAGFTSGNITFNLSNPTQTATESFITSNIQAIIVSGNYLGSSGNVSVGGYMGISAGAAAANLVPLIVESVASPTDDANTSAMTDALAEIAGVASNSTFVNTSSLVAPSATGLSGLSGNAGAVSIGDFANLKSGGSATSQPGAIAIGSYSTIGNAGNVSTGVSDTRMQHIIASSGGSISIFSEAVLNGSYASATTANPGGITVNGVVSSTSSGSAGKITIQNVGTGTSISTSSPGVTIGNGISGDPALLDASSQTANGGIVAIYAPYGVVTVDMTSSAAYAVNVSGFGGSPGSSGTGGAGGVDIYGGAGVDIISGGVAAMGGINNGHGGGGGISIASGGYITALHADINSSSAYGGGGGVAIFSTASGTSGPVNLGSGSIINTSGGGSGGGGAILIAGSGNVSISGATLTASGNGGGAIALDSGAGKIIFAGSNVFTSLQSGTVNASFGGGGGYTVALTASPKTLNVGGGGGANGGYSGGGVALTGTPTFSGTTFTDGIQLASLIGFGRGTAPGGTSSGGVGNGQGGIAGGGNAGAPGGLFFSGSEVDFGVPGSSTPVSLTTSGNGQIYNSNIVLYAPTTLTESGSGTIQLNGSGTAPSISTAPGVTAGLTVVDNTGNIVFGPNFTFATGSNALSSLSVTDTSGQIQLYSGGGNFVSTTSGAQTFSGTTLVEETGSTGSFIINAGGEITLTGSLTGVASGTTTAQPLDVSLTSSQAYASGAYAIDVGLNVNTGGGNFLADASSGGNIQLGLFGTGATAGTIDTSGTTSNGSITIESIASTGNSGGIVMSPAGESLITGGAGAVTPSPTGPGSVTLESSAVAGTAHNINITGAIDTSSTTGNGGDVTIQTIGQAGTTGGNITIGSNTSTAGTGYINTSTTNAGSTGGNVVLNSGTGTVNINTAGDPGIAINTSGTPGGSITLTGYNGLNLSAGNITSGGGAITLQNLTGLLSLGAITLDSSAAAGGGNILIQTQTGGNGNIELNGTTVNSGSATTDNGGTITLDSLGTLTLAGTDTFNSSGPVNGPVNGGTPGAITLTAAGNLTQTSNGSLAFALSGDTSPVDVTFNPGTPTGTVNLAGSLAFTGTYTGTTGPDANLTINSLGALALGTMNGDFALVVNTLTGGIVFNGSLGQSSALDSVTATAGTGSGATTGGVTVNGAITTMNNISLQPNSGTFLGGAGAGDYRPDGVLAINGNLTSTNGNIDLSPAGRSVVPSVASISSSRSVVISAPNGSITMGPNERYTALGSLTIAAGTAAGDTATIGDLNSLGNLNVSANTIDILLRQPGAILTSFGSLDSGVSPATDGTQFIANGPITFTGTVTTSGTGNPPRFASVSDSGSVPAPYTISFFGAGTEFAGRPITPSMAVYNGTVLVLSANGPVAQLVQIYTQNVAPVVPQKLPTVQYPVIAPPAVNSWDQSILHGVGVNAANSSARQILAGMMGATVYENSMYGAAGAQAQLPASQLTPDSLQQFLNVYHKLFSFEVPANYSPYKPSGWFTRPTWYEVAGRHKDIHNTLSLAYSLYQDSLGASAANDTFLQFVDHNRAQSKIFKQSAYYLALLQQLNEAIYQMGITPSEFQAIEVKFFKPLAPDGMPFSDFMSEIAPAQLLPAGPTAE